MQQTAPFQSAFRAAAAAERKIRESQVVVPDRTERTSRRTHQSGMSVQDRIALLKRDRLQEPPAAEEEDESEMEMSMQLALQHYDRERRAKNRVDKPEESVLDRINCSE
jgi:hypothetical protein